MRYDTEYITALAADKEIAARNARLDSDGFYREWAGEISPSGYARVIAAWEYDQKLAEIDAEEAASIERGEQ